MKRFLLTIVSLFLTTPGLAAEKQIDIFPASPYDQSTIYLNLLLFWLLIAGVVVVLWLKLREIERVQKMDKTKKQLDIPFLE